MNLYSHHPENPACTRAFLLVTRGECDKAKAILEAIGYLDADVQIEMIEGFIKFQEGCNQQKRKPRNSRTQSKLAREE